MITLAVVGTIGAPADSERERMTLNEIRDDFSRHSEKICADVMNRYNEQKVGSGGHEGLGIYGICQGKIAKRKVQIAVKLLGQNGVEPTVSNIYRVTMTPLSSRGSESRSLTPRAE